MNVNIYFLINSAAFLFCRQFFMQGSSDGHCCSAVSILLMSELISKHSYSTSPQLAWLVAATVFTLLQISHKKFEGVHSKEKLYGFCNPLPPIVFVILQHAVTFDSDLRIYS